MESNFFPEVIIDITNFIFWKVFECYSCILLLFLLLLLLIVLNFYLLFWRLRCIQCKNIRIFLFTQILYYFLCLDRDSWSACFRYSRRSVGILLDSILPLFRILNCSWPHVNTVPWVIFDLAVILLLINFRFPFIKRRSLTVFFAYSKRPPFWWRGSQSWIKLSA